MKLFFPALLLLVLAVARTQAQAPATSDNYQFFVDLTRVQNDQLQVSLIVPRLATDEAVYCLPKIVPGTYSIYDFGRFVHDLAATDAQGRALPVERLDDNRWKISQAKSAYRLTYRVDDTYDTNLGNFVFEPCGTNIEENENFIINTHGFFGYFEGMRRNDYELTVTKPTGFYGATALRPVDTSPTQDRFLVENYERLVDSPLMYNRPDTTIMHVGGAEIVVSVYSPDKKLTSKFVADNIRGILNAQKNYLGGQLPVDRYAFIIYLFKGASGSGMIGALEHSYSSLYFLPETEGENIAQFIRDVAAHEFFHIVTPLNIHSEEIQFFDFNSPQMSKHLWLYEGVIEYFAGHVQVKEGLMNLPDYLEVLRGKIGEARGYNDSLPFTVMSKGCLDRYKDQYGNVYAKGALIGMCLDIKLRQLSGGSYGVQDLLANLAKEYGKDKPFKDEELFDKIVKMTYPEIGEFFRQHVEGSAPLPFAELLGDVGIVYERTEEIDTLSFGHIFPTVDLETDSTAVIIADIEELADPKQVPYQVGDRIVSIDGQPITVDNFFEVVTAITQKGQPGQAVPMTVRRGGQPGGKKAKEKKVKVLLYATKYIDQQFLDPVKNPTEAQLRLRKAWLAQ
jgi:predicted metalloprotease with PDZ domain